MKWAATHERAVAPSYAMPGDAGADLCATHDVRLEPGERALVGTGLPAYDYVLKCSHAFNLLDARGAISVTERQGYILRVRALAKSCCAAYLEPVAEASKGEE